MIRLLPHSLSAVRLILALAVTVKSPFSEKWVMFAIILGIITDIADGMVARRLGVVSNLGFWLDSIADIVCFGLLLSTYLLVAVSSSSFVAATLMIYSLGRTSWRQAKQWGPPLPVVGITATITAQFIDLGGSLAILLTAMFMGLWEMRANSQGNYPFS